MNQWRIYKGVGEPHDEIQRLPPPPPWRAFTGNIIDVPLLDDDNDFMKRMLARGEVFQASEEVIELVNAALYLRRPLLVSGKPGYGKSSLAYSIARELKLGPVLRWSTTTRSTLADGLYSYDALARLQDTSYWKGTSVDDKPPDIGQYIRLGPLGAALLPSEKPRVLLIDEIDKSDIDLPNDLLHIFEEGEFDIPELVRLSQQNKVAQVYLGKNSSAKVSIVEGHVRCFAFPLIVMTSNEEREFPPAFLRRCLRLTMKEPTKDELIRIVEAHLGTDVIAQVTEIIDEFVSKRQHGDLATDQLLNAVYLASRGFDTRERRELFEAILKHLTS